MHEQADKALQIAHGRLNEMAERADGTTNEQLLLMHEMAQIVYQVGWAIVRQLAAGPDK